MYRLGQIRHTGGNRSQQVVEIQETQGTDLRCSYPDIHLFFPPKKTKPINFKSFNAKKDNHCTYSLSG